MIELVKLNKVNDKLFESCETCGRKDNLYSLRLGSSSTTKTINLCEKHMEEVYDVLKEWKESKED